MGAMFAKPGTTEWKPGRGDYGAEHAGDVLLMVEATTCSRGHGCVHAGSDSDREEFGPGGNCVVLARLFRNEVMPELDPQPSGPVCRSYEQRPDPAVAGIEPLFGEAS